MRNGSTSGAPRRRMLIAGLVACGLWLPLQNLALLAVALGRTGSAQSLLHSARDLALPVLVGVAIAWTLALVAGMVVVWSLRGRARAKEGVAS